MAPRQTPSWRGIARSSGPQHARACAGTQALIDASRRLIPIRGGSDNDPLPEKIRAAIAAGTLPRIDLRSWAGKVQGERVCACCALPIEPGEVEYEPQASPGLYAHMSCFAVWHAESQRLERDGTAQPKGTAASA